MTDQPTLFTTPAEDRAAAAREREQRLFELVRVPGGFQCPTCGQIEETELGLDMHHGYPQDGIRPFGTWCFRLLLRRNHARYALRCGDVEFWVRAAADLREIARWRAAQ
jgi:hypothetical protein